MLVHGSCNSRFDIEWSEFRTRFQQLFDMNEVSEENKRAIFLALCGDIYDERMGNDGNLRWFRHNEPCEFHLHRRRHGHHGPHRHGHHKHHPHRRQNFRELHGRFRCLSTD